MPAKRADFHYDLPEDLIAQAPLRERSASRLLVLDRRSGDLTDARFAELPALLEPGDLLVFNDTRVLPARVFAVKASGGRAELLLERVTGPASGRFQIRASRSPKAGATLALPGGHTATVTGREGDLFELGFDCALVPFLERHGAVPLPPYIGRAPGADDADRYQTVFARAAGAVAAPTAGLHFDAAVLAALAARGVERAFVTLHVGAGTFAPIRTENIEDHRLHAEWLEVPVDSCAQIAAARARGGRVIAVGTTTVRALEAAARAADRRSPGERPATGAAKAGATLAPFARLAPFAGETRLFISPGFEFRVVDGLVTNFHLPESSLLVLVAAFAGYDSVMHAYAHAVAERYRFFSYGDAMLILSSAAESRSARA